MLLSIEKGSQSEEFNHHLKKTKGIKNKFFSVTMENFYFILNFYYLINPILVECVSNQINSCLLSSLYLNVA